MTKVNQLYQEECDLFCNKLRYFGVSEDEIMEAANQDNSLSALKELYKQAKINNGQFGVGA